MVAIAVALAILTLGVAAFSIYWLGRAQAERDAMTAQLEAEEKGKEAHAKLDADYDGLGPIDALAKLHSEIQK